MPAKLIQKIPSGPPGVAKRFLTFSGLATTATQILFMSRPLSALVCGTYPAYASEYALASWFINYRNGFLSRGLAGSIAAALFPLDRYVSDVGLVTNVLAVSAIAIWVLYSAALIGKFGSDAYLPIAMFCMPWISIFAVDMMQPRMDLILIFIYEACAVIYLTRTKWRLPVATAASAAAIFIHQGFALFFVPFLFILISKRDGMKKAVLYGALMLAPFALCQFVQVPTEETILESAYEMQEASDFDEGVRLPGLFEGVENRTESMIRMEYGEDKKINNFELVGESTEGFRSLFADYVVLSILLLILYPILSNGLWRNALYAAAVFGCYAVVLYTQTDWLRFLIFFETGFSCLVATDLLTNDAERKIPFADSWFAAIFVAAHQISCLMRTAFI